MDLSKLALQVSFCNLSTSKMFSRLAAFSVLALPLFAVATPAPRNTPTTACCASTESVSVYSCSLHAPHLAHRRVGRLCCGHCDSQGYRYRCERHQRIHRLDLQPYFRRWCRIWLRMQWYDRVLLRWPLRRCFSLRLIYSRSLLPVQGSVGVGCIPVTA